MNPYRHFVTEFERLVKRAGQASIKPSNRSKRNESFQDSPKVLIFAPHPDDECIIGGLALRLSREMQWNVSNVAVTLGSNKKRRPARLRELKNACAQLNFGLIVAGGKGLENVTLNTRKLHPRQWAKSVAAIAQILKSNRPRVIFIPHDRDGHEAHIGTHHVVLDALRSLPPSFECFVVETEFWGQLTGPNLVVEMGATDLADLMTALAMHVGEVKRNPYHVRLPAWMMDNARRGELVGGFGSGAPKFTFATIYRLKKWQRGRLANVLLRGKYLSCAENPGLLFK